MSTFDTIKKILQTTLVSVLFVFLFSTQHVHAQLGGGGVGNNPPTTNGSIIGWGWSDTVGWISFSCTTDGTNCANSIYGVTVTPGQQLGAGNFDISIPTGVLSGYAWAPTIGWISFNDRDVSVCGRSAEIDFATGGVSGFARALSGNQASHVSGDWSGCIAFSYTIDRDNSGIVTYDENSYDGTGYNTAVSIIGRASIFREWAWGSSNDETDGVIGWIDMKRTRYLVVAEPVVPRPTIVLDASTLTVPAPYYVDLTWYAVDENGIASTVSNLNFTSCQAYTYNDQGQLVTVSSPFDGNITDPPSGQVNVFVPFAVTDYLIDCKWPNPNNGGIIETVQSNTVRVRRFINTDLPIVNITGPACVVFPNSIPLTWSISNADSCNVTTVGSVPTTPTGGISIIPPAVGTYVYLLNCQNDQGISSDSVTVQVLDRCPTDPPPPVKKKKFLFFEF